MAAPPIAKLAATLHEHWAPVPGETVHDRRARFEASVASVPLAAGMTAQPIALAGRPAELWNGQLPEGGPTVLYFHGGGYTTGSLATVRPLASRLAAACGARLVTIDYRLAPEHPHPAAVEDALAAYTSLLDHGNHPAQLALAGDSAGGGLTIAALLAIRDAGLPQPAAALCISPWVDLTLSARSLTVNAAEDPLVSEWQLREMATEYLAGGDPRSPTASPRFANLSGLPPLLIQVGTAEALLDDSRLLAASARAYGVDVVLDCWSDMIHVWHAFAPRLPEANEAIKAAGEWLSQHLQRVKLAPTEPG